MLLFWNCAIVCAQPTTAPDSIIQPTLTPIEVRTALDITDRLSESHQHYNNLRTIAIAQNHALRQAEATIIEIKETAAHNDSLQQAAQDADRTANKMIESELNSTKTKGTIKGALLYIVTGVAIAEAGYIIFKP